MACQQRCLQRHVRDHCHCYDESLPIENPEPNIPPCRELDFPPECAMSPDDIAPCIDALMTWYERLKCAKTMREQVRDYTVGYENSKGTRGQIGEDPVH